MPINLLRPETAAKIAAGEVVERPASVAKELIENALDAGATRVDIEVRAGGVGLLRVADNGSGMSVEDLPLAFRRYATSKIASAEDLEHIATHGFRGEALPSIAAVAEVAVLTRRHEDMGGTYLRIAGGEVLDREPRGAPPGTSVTVRKLFQNVPARLKFLRSNQAEAGRIATLVSHFALAYPEVHFALSVEGRTVLETSGDGDLRQVAVQVYGLEAAEGLLAVEWESGHGTPLRVGGLASGPSVSRSSRSYITLFVNRRLVQNRSLLFAVTDAYQGLLMTGRHPIAILNLFIDPAETDVNVHPTKAEIKFRDEGLAFSALGRAVRQALAASGLARPASGTLAEPPPVFQAEPEVRGEAAVSLGIAQARAPAARPEEDRGPVPAAPDGRPEGAQAQASHPMGLPILRPLGQVGRTYIVAEGPDGMYLIDQHAAHERVLFDRLKRQKAGQEAEVQGLLEPVAVELTHQQATLLASNAEALGGCGFTLETFGPRSVLLRAVPAGLMPKGPARALLDLLDGLERSDLAGYSWEERVLATVACHSAVRAGQGLAPKEMEQIVRLLESTDNPRTCPHGRPTMLHMSSVQLEKEFGRR